MTPYETLGIPKDADAVQIKAAYRKLAQQLHPDREGGDKEKFQAVSAAYELLSDPQKRAHYDQTGSMPGQPPSDLEQAMTVICTAIEQAMMVINPEFTDPLKTAASNIKSAIEQIHAQIMDLERRKKTTETAMKRLTVKDGKEDRCTMVFQMLLDKIAGPLAHMKEQQPVLELALKILSDHEYKVDPASHPSQSLGGLYNSIMNQRSNGFASW